MPASAPPFGGHGGRGMSLTIREFARVEPAGIPPASEPQHLATIGQTRYAKYPPTAHRTQSLMTQAHSTRSGDDARPFGAQRLVCFTGDDLDCDRIRQLHEVLRSPTDKLISPVSRALLDQRGSRHARK